ncbi:Fatty acid hydroxylase superfamily protein [Labrenzia sp. THAF82]|uniref:sterol desaturase family protein n=1 Tax=Labrenzia sp. THAF82 TaxID=2587861 RepID=UPI0012689C3B|nr:sterol desaturase family protein [Labrenzia sp. THAF82]QFT30049.1 Fatty acid hydroxylase superfamily protein [Labrenzia sp. THAF82]
MFDNIELRLSVVDPVFSVIEMIGLVFLLMLVSEAAWDVFSGYRKSLKETGANIFISIVNSVLERLAFGAIFVVGIFASEKLAVSEVSLSWWSWLLAVLLADLTYYWMHRCEHRVRLLWTYHSVHHSSPEFNFSTALRLAWVEALFTWIFFVPMVVIGFDPAQVIGALAVVIAYQSWIHTEKFGKVRILDAVLNTPSNHRVHHGRNRIYLDKNFGGILIIWDKLFGTYAPETEEVLFGITKPVGSSNPFVINFSETALMLKEVFRPGPMKLRLGRIFMPPGWSDNAKPRRNKTS